MASLASPGICVKIREEVLDIRNEQGTKVLINGFTPRGDSYSPVFINSLSDFENRYGLPSEPVEKYAYHAVKENLEAGADVLFTRLPYGSGAGLLNQEEYTALVFPVIGLSASEKNVCDWYEALTEQDYLEKFPWILDTNDFVLSNYTLGSPNILCDITSTQEPSGVFVMHNYPAPADGFLREIKFKGEDGTTDDDSTAEQIKFFILRQTSADNWTIISETSAFNDEVIDINEDGLYTITFGSSGIPMERGDILAHYSPGSVLRYYPSNQTSRGKSNIVSVDSGDLEEDFVIEHAIVANGDEFLLNYSFAPSISGLDCQSLIEAGLQIPEQWRYDINVLPGDSRLEDANYYLLGQPKQITINEEQYKQLVDGQFNWECGALANATPGIDFENSNVKAGLIIVDELREKVCDDFSGWYIGVTDNANFNPTTDFRSFTGIYGRFESTCNGVSGTWQPVPEDRWNFKVWNLYGELGSLSEQVEKYAPAQFGTPLYQDHLNITVWKLIPDAVGNFIKLNAELYETHSGSFDSKRRFPNSSGSSTVNGFLPEVMKRSGSRLNVFLNKYITDRNCWTDETTGLPKKKIRLLNGVTFVSEEQGLDPEEQMQGYADNLFSLGSCAITCEQRLIGECHSKDIGNLPTKLQIALRGVENPELYDIDLSIDAGLSTVWATRNSVEATNCDVCPDSYVYDDNVYVNLGFLKDYDGLKVTTPAKAGWDTIFNIFRSFVDDQRVSNCGVPIFHIQDPLRQIFVNGNTRTYETKKVIITSSEATGQTFARTIWAPLRNLLEGASSPYVGLWANWIKAYNAADDSIFWAPSSPFASAMLVRNDLNGPQTVGTAPFGILNGEIKNVIGGQSGLAINPYQKERDKLAEISANPIIYLKSEGGIYSFNHRTLLRSENALRSRVPVSRTFIDLAKQGQEVSFAFLNQPNTIITRTNLRNALESRLKPYKDNGVLEKYRIVMETSNAQTGGLRKRINVFIYLTFSGWVEEVVLNFIGTDDNSVSVSLLE